MQVTIKPFDPKTASDTDWQAITDLANVRGAIILPDDPPQTKEFIRQNMLSTPPVVTEYHWFAWTDKGELVGRGEVDIINMEENKHVGQVYLFVHPDWRRQGIGSKLLALIAEKARENERRLLIGNVYERDSAGQGFGESIGAEVGLAAHTNQLKLEEVDRELIQMWVDRAAERASGYALEFWDGPYPEEEMGRAVEMVKAMNSAPTGDLDMEDFNFTPEILRQIEDMFAAQGIVRWTYVAREKATRDLAGYTEIMWMPTKPQIAFQDATGVLRAAPQPRVGALVESRHAAKNPGRKTGSHAGAHRKRRHERADVENQ